VRLSPAAVFRRGDRSRAAFPAVPESRHLKNHPARFPIGARAVQRSP
jgi:hypothetical protein